MVGQHNPLRDGFKVTRWHTLGTSEVWYAAWNAPSVHCANICHYDWFSKQADWPVAGQDKVRQESQTENDVMKKDRVRGDASQLLRKQDM